MSNQIDDVKPLSNSVGVRLREEVTRIGGVAKAMDVLRGSRATLYNWFESGLIPASELEALDSLGVDVLFVTTGRRDRSAALAAAGDLAATQYARISDFVTSGESGKIRVEVAGQPFFVNPDDYRWVPVLNVRVSGGPGMSAFGENVIAFNAWRREWLAKKGLLDAVLSEVTVTGESMSPELREGDVVLVNHSANELQGGGIYVIRQGDELIVKYLQPLPGDRIQVNSENSGAFPSYVIEPADFESGECEIIGRVVRQGRER